MTLKTKRYIISSLTTFGTTFAIVVLAQIDNFTMQAFASGAVWGIIFTAVRSGVKSLLEYWVS